MKPLVYYCRWHDATLRLRGRDKTAVWGHLVFTDKDGGETEQEFYFNLPHKILTLISNDGEKQLLLDEMGTVINE